VQAIHYSPRSPRPITAHHLFPVGIALWFGALFSLSSLAVRTELFEAMVMASRIDQLLPAASPPLGHTARLVLAASFGIIGATVGLLLARLLVSAATRTDQDDDADHAWHWQDEPAPATPTPSSDYRADARTGYRVRPRDAHPDAPARRPISARDELGPEGFDAPFESRPLTHAVAQAWASEAPAPAPQSFLQPESARPESAQPESSSASTVVWPEHAFRAPAGTPENQPVIQAEPALAEPEPVATAPSALLPAWTNTAERIAVAPPTVLSHVELVERLAMALEKHEQDHDAASGDANAGTAEGSPARPSIDLLREALAHLRGS
jgi:hypothetical protein